MTVLMHPEWPRPYEISLPVATSHIFIVYSEPPVTKYFPLFESDSAMHSSAVYGLRDVSIIRTGFEEFKFQYVIFRSYPVVITVYPSFTTSNELMPPMR